MSLETQWPAWLAGMSIGLFVVFQYWLTGKPLGCSSAYGHACGLTTGVDFYRTGSFGRENHWRLWFLLGTPLGGLIGTWGMDPGTWETTLDMGATYQALLPDSLVGQGLVLLLGGAFIGIGARMAGGCTSGHTIVGVPLGAPASLAASAGFFIGGVTTIQLAQLIRI